MRMSMYSDLSLDGRTLTFSLASGQSVPVAVEAQPVHIYGFDMQSLNIAYRFLDEPTKPFEIGLVGVNRHNSPERTAPVLYFGRTVFEYEGEEQLHGAACRKYKMTGPGMEGKDASVWFNRDAGHIERIESPWPASDDWTTYKLELTKVERMTPVEWQDFKAGVVAKFTRQAIT